SSAESAAIGDLLRRVRGVPLASELCAARFAGGDGGALFSARGLRVGSADAQAIAWSFAQLDPWERELLAQCSVFRGGFTLAAAERVVELPPPRRGAGGGAPPPRAGGRRRPASCSRRVCSRRCGPTASHAGTCARPCACTRR